MKPSAVVFDCDGVLVDSEPHSRRSWVSVLTELGHPATEADVATCTGLDYRQTHRALEQLGPLPDVADLWPNLLEALRRSYQEGLATFPDAMDVLGHAVEMGVRVAVASNSPRQRLDVTLQSAGLADYFPFSVAGDDVEHGKPAPDVYLAALGALGVPATEAVAIEDSVMGVRSAAAAGLRVVAVVREEEAREPLRATGATVVDIVSLADVGF